MAAGRATEMVRSLCRAAQADATDGELLTAYVARGDGAAFAGLVRRHGPMVLGVCRRLTGDPHDAEDAFQATFLVLARKAAAVRPRDAVGGWLYGVARRTARDARRAAGRRRAREGPMADLPHPPDPDAAWDDIRTVLDEELARLPAGYRLAVVLCDLEGRPRREAARHLGVPHGTLSNRLAAARRMLARRLVRRGVTLAGGALAVTLTRHAAADVPAALAAAAARAADPTTAVASAAVTVLTEGAIKAMFLAKLKLTSVLLILVTAAGLGGGMLTRPVAADQPPAAKGVPAPKSKASAPPAREIAIRAALESPVSVDFEDAPVTQVIKDLAALTGLNLVADRPALERDGLSLATRLTVKLDRVSLKTCLKMILRQAGMTYVVEDEVILVTSPERARGRLMVRSLRVDDLVRPDDEKAEALIKVITNAVRPDSWSAAGGPGTIEYYPLGRSLVVNQHPETLEQVEALLEALRGYRKDLEKKTPAGRD
jgi:RNA polymerase sigma factor (sigma-70 family)